MGAKKFVPRQKPGLSEQVVVTPMDFIRAIRNRFGPVVADLAATAQNKRAPRFFGPPLTDSLQLRWESIPCKKGDVLYLNPQFEDIAPWMEKAFRYEGPAQVGVLTPASINSAWFARHVYGRARVYSPHPKLTFEGHEHQYPKDLLFSLYIGRERHKSFEVWHWRDWL